MREFRKKQKRLFKIMKGMIGFTVAYILIFIGVTPTVQSYSNQLFIILNYGGQVLALLALCIIFLYYSRYGKSNSFLERTEREIDDYAYYYTSVTANNERDFINHLTDEFKHNGYNIAQNTEISEFDFDICAEKKNEFFYAANISKVSRNDVLAYLDTVITDITVHKIKRKGNAVMCFVTDKAEDDAVAISKMITPLGKKEQLKIALCIVEPETKKCYFLGNMETKCQQMILKYVMNSSSPISDNLKGERHMAFQDELEERMKAFNIKDFKDGTFYLH